MLISAQQRRHVLVISSAKKREKISSIPSRKDNSSDACRNHKLNKHEGKRTNPKRDNIQWEAEEAGHN